MKDTSLTDFYQDWLIEVAQEEGGFRIVCYSPSRQQLSDRTLHPHDFEALRAARKLIDQRLVCYSLANLLRDWYESDLLSFDEWRSLNQSLLTLTKTS